MTRKSVWFSALLTLPLLGWVLIAPLLVTFPVYPDETEWKAMTSRLFLDGGKLHYIFPACSKGRLLDSPISWYPLELIHALFYSDMTNPQQVLRLWGVAVFCALVAYLTWFVWYRIRPQLNPLAVAGALLAPLSVGVVPFLMVLNRPEQGLIVVLTVACTVPLALEGRKLNPSATWLLALAYVLLAWLAVATHAKGILILPMVIFGAFLSLRHWRATSAVVLAAGFGAWETSRLWNLRTDCPESPFLTRIFGGLTISGDDLSHGFLYVLKQIAINFRYTDQYWLNAGFQNTYESAWLPAADSHLTIAERLVNATVPLLMATAVVIVVFAALSAVVSWLRERRRPDPATFLAATLMANLFFIVGFQKGRNFYESTWILWILALAVLLVVPFRTPRFGRPLIASLAVLAVASQSLLAARFYPMFGNWYYGPDQLPAQQQRIHTLVARCGLKIDQSTSHLAVDATAFTVLWPTREPYLLTYIDGWWGSETDPGHVIQDAGISGAVGFCRPLFREHWATVISDGEFCCAK